MWLMNALWHKPKYFRMRRRRLPLTTITAWEILFDRFDLHGVSVSDKSIVIIGLLGELGLMVQSQQTKGLRVIGTASGRKLVIGVFVVT